MLRVAIIGSVAFVSQRRLLIYGIMNSLLVKLGTIQEPLFTY